MCEVGVEYRLCPLEQCALYRADFKEIQIKSVKFKGRMYRYSAYGKKIVEIADKILFKS
jgi:hypothetical protein